MKRAEKFIILASMRTGSHHLQSLLDSHPDILCMSELIHKGEPGKGVIDSNQLYDYPGYIDSKIKLQDLHSRNQAIELIKEFYMINNIVMCSAIGFTFFCNHLGYFRCLQALAYFKRNRIKIIHLTRRNLLRQYPIATTTKIKIRRCTRYPKRAITRRVPKEKCLY